MNGQNSTTVNTAYHGSQCLKYEGCNEPENIIKEIICTLNLVKDENFKKNDRKRMKKSQDCCAKLYTKQCFLFRVVNTALRDDDRTKLETLGPYCYLVYNYIGRHIKDNFPIRRRLSQIVHPTESQSMIICRGDYAPLEKI
ncbi:unnamed protein product [Rotaria sordida]|uniref:Uncharacterized protein n=1 Tax=Rotaria sordida TaxID=392033 RepID=A0A816F794_9BILA|nr:unnamed protein product [Rotaria sordida]CAF1655837.1 unnamed protein product [Rotaria sordida]